MAAKAACWTSFSNFENDVKTLFSECPVVKFKPKSKTGREKEKFRDPWRKKDKMTDFAFSPDRLENNSEV